MGTDRGFTLSEIIFALAIILVLASVMIPVSFPKLRDAELTSALSSSLRDSAKNKGRGESCAFAAGGWRHCRQETF